MGPGARWLLALASAVIVMAGIRAAQPILTPILLAGLITMAGAPLLQWLRHRRVPDWASISVVLLASLSVVVLLGVLIGGSVNAFVERAPKYEADLRLATSQLTFWLSDKGINLSADALDELVDLGPALALVGGLLQGLANFASMTMLVLLIVAFMLFESLGLRAKLERIALHPTHIGELEHASRLVYRYLGVKTLTSGATGLLVGLWTATLGLELSVLWGLLAFMLNYVPTIGSVIAAVPAVILALLQGGAGVALAVALGYLVVNFAIGNGIEPRVMGAALGLSPLVVIFSLLLWGYLLGPVGALLSVPLTLVVRIFLASMSDLAWLSVLLGPTHSDDIVANTLPPPPPPPGEYQG